MRRQRAADRLFPVTRFLRWYWLQDFVRFCGKRQLLEQCFQLGFIEEVDLVFAGLAAAAKLAFAQQQDVVEQLLDALLFFCQRPLFFSKSSFFFFEHIA